MTRAGWLFAASLVASTPLSGQDAAHTDYFHAVAGFFNLPPSEVAILAEWDLPAQEIPVVLFVARRAGVSPEALVALRDAGRSWSELTARYHVGAPALHVPVPEDADTGRLSRAYTLFQSTPVGEWGTLTLPDADIVGLVNVRVISQALELPAERVLGETGSADSYVQLFARLSR